MELSVNLRLKEIYQWLRSEQKAKKMENTIIREINSALDTTYAKKF